MPTRDKNAFRKKGTEEKQSRGVVTDKLLWHGTSPSRVLNIVQNGFKLLKQSNYKSNDLGRGIYITSDLDWAYWFAEASSEVSAPYQLIIKCRLEPSTRLLVIDGEHVDRNIVDRLVREFGREILRSPSSFHKAIPRNKHLTKEEFRTLCGYFLRYREHRSSYDENRDREWWCLNFPRLGEYLRRYGYSGITDTNFGENSLNEIVVTNPTLVTPLTVHKVFHNGMSARLSAEPLDTAALRAEIENFASFEETERKNAPYFNLLIEELRARLKSE